jgi:hypothetical protein
MPTPFLVDGPAVVVPARVAALLERALGLGEFRVRVRGQDRELDEVLLALHGSAAAWVEEQREQGEFRAGVTSVDDARNSPDPWSTEEVAATVDCTQHAVRKAARNRRLVGELVAGRWRFDPEDVGHWQATRKRGA